MLDPRDIWKDVQAIRQSSPLIHNITNYVVMNITANSLLAIGASPVMTHSEEEVCEMVQSARAVVLNMGTLDSAWEMQAKRAMQAAHANKVPIVFDPAGVGATSYRTQMALSMLEEGKLSVMRGNASEIAVLGGWQGATKGVDTALDSTEALPYASQLANTQRCIVIVSGRVDVVTDGKRQMLLKNGHPLMGRVTGMGCTATALVGAFLAVNADFFLAGAHAMSFMGIAGEIAATRAHGLGSFQEAFIDALDTITLPEIERYLCSEDV